MRYEKGHKQQTKERIVSQASRRFRRDGIGATGIAGLMADAGLTHGGFYVHFSSKEDLVGEAVVAALAEARKGLEKSCRESEDPLEALINFYLSPGHRDRPQAGCMLAAAAPEIARNSRKTRKRVTKELSAYLKLAEDALPGKVAPADRPDLAKAVFSLLIGALQLARMTRDETISENFLHSGRAAIHRLVEPSASAKRARPPFAPRTPL